MTEQTYTSTLLMCHMEHSRRALLLQLQCMAYNQSIQDCLQVVENKVLRKILQQVRYDLCITLHNVVLHIS